MEDRTATRKKWWDPEHPEHDVPFAYRVPENKNLKDASDFYRTQPVLDRRIHILGMGAMGRFMAHALRGIVNPPPVTLIFPWASHLKEWNESPQKLQLITEGAIEKRDGYDAEVAFMRLRAHGRDIRDVYDSDGEGSRPEVLEGESNETINSLILCCSATKVLQSLSAVKHRLHKDSVVLFMQNGMGVVEEVNREIFPDPETRPRYMLGVNTHNVQANPEEHSAVIHASSGTMALGLLPHEREREASPYAPLPKFGAFGNQAPVEPKHAANPDPDTPAPRESGMKWTPNDRYLLRTLLRTPVLCATGFSPPDLLQLQLELLAVNSIIGPLTCMIDARNGSLLYNFYLTRTMRLLLSEISLIIRSLPELQYIPNVAQRFDPGRLETMVVGVANKSRDSVSKMLAAVRNGRQTEIDYLNGWVVKKGEEMGVRCFMNYMMLNLVKGKQAMILKETGEEVPFAFELEQQKKSNEGSIRVRREAEGELEDD